MRASYEVPDEQVGLDYDAGASIIELAGKYSAAPNTIRAAIMNTGRVIRQRGNPHAICAEEFVADVAALREAGKTWAAIGEKYGASKQAVQQRYAYQKGKAARAKAAE